MSWDIWFKVIEDEPACCPTCGQETDEGEERCTLTDEGLAMVEACLQLKGLSGGEIASLENAAYEFGSDDEDVDRVRISTIFQNHASELL